MSHPLPPPPPPPPPDCDAAAAFWPEGSAGMSRAVNTASVWRRSAGSGCSFSPGLSPLQHLGFSSLNVALSSQQNVLHCACRTKPLSLCHWWTTHFFSSPPLPLWMWMGGSEMFKSTPSYSPLFLFKGTFSAVEGAHPKLPRAESREVFVHSAIFRRR